MKPSKLIIPIFMALLSIAMLIGVPVFLRSLPDPNGANGQWIALFRTIGLAGLLAAAYSIYSAFKHQKETGLAWEPLNGPPAEPGKYLVRFDADEAAQEVFVKSDGRVYEKDAVWGPVDRTLQYTKSMEWAKVG